MRVVPPTSSSTRRSTRWDSARIRPILARSRRGSWRAAGDEPRARSARSGEKPGNGRETPTTSSLGEHHSSGEKGGRHEDTSRSSHDPGSGALGLRKRAHFVGGRPRGCSRHAGRDGHSRPSDARTDAVALPPVPEVPDRRSMMKALGRAALLKAGASLFVGRCPASGRIITRGSAIANPLGFHS